MENFLQYLSLPQVIWLSTFAYFSGSIPFGFLLVRWFKGKNIRQMGSTNIGATNVAQSSSKALGVLTLILDAGKGYVPVAIAISFLLPAEICAFVGLAAVLGHCFPIWLKFAGGKGVATGFGAILALSITIGLIGAGIFLIIALVTKKVCVGVVIAGLALLLASFFMLSDLMAKIFVASIIVIVILRHKENMSQLFLNKNAK